MEKATDKQLSLMSKLGIQFDPQKDDKYDAIRLIKDKIGEREDSPPKDVTNQYVKTNGKEKLIIRQCCLKASVELWSSVKEINRETILETAEAFETWVNR